MLRIASSLALATSVALFTACSHEAPPPAESPSAAPESSAPSATPEATASAPAEVTPAPAASAAEPASSEPAAPPPPPPGAAKRAPCTLGQDQTCNGDPSVSAIWGKCLPTGTCECKPGFELAPTGYCKPAK